MTTPVLFIVGGVAGADSTTLSESLVGVGALDREGELGAETPNVRSCLRCSDFCFLSKRSASISALLCSLLSMDPDLVLAPAGRLANQDMYLGYSLRSLATGPAFRQVWSLSLLPQHS